jgi:hypothetical protein
MSNATKFLKTLTFTILAGALGFSNSARAQNRSAADWAAYYRGSGSNADTLRAVTGSQNSYQERVGACMAGSGTWDPNGAGGAGACGGISLGSVAQPAAQAPAPSEGGLAFPDTRGGENGYSVAQVDTPMAGAAAEASSGGVCVAASCFQNRYQGQDGDTLQAVMNNPNASAQERLGACMAADARGCGSYQQAADAEAAGGAAAAGGAPGTADTGKQTSCESAASTAKSACLMPGTDGMDPGTAAMFSMMMTSQLPAMATQIATIGKNMAQQCKVQADVAKLMTAINGIKGAACATTISTCRSTCGEEATQWETQYNTHIANTATQALAAEDKKKMVKANRSATQCGAYTGQVIGMMMSAMQNGVQIVANKQCESDLSAFNTAAPTYTPPALAQIGGCEDPNNQTLACYCTRPGNASSAMCSGFAGGNLAGGGTTTTPNGSTVASPYASTAGDVTDGNTADPFAAPGQKGGGDGKGPGDGGSGAPGGGGLASFGSEGGGGGYGSDPKSAITGTSGGTGSGLGGAGGGGGGGLARNNGTAGGSKGGFFDKFNLKKFLPGSKYKTRGIAGMSVKSVDGITGPMGPSLFEKATRQYQEQIQKQTVILDK